MSYSKYAAPLAREAFEASVDLGLAGARQGSQFVDDLLRIARQNVQEAYTPSMSVSEVAEQVAKKANPVVDNLLAPLGRNLGTALSMGIPVIGGAAALPFVLKGLAPLYGLGGDKQETTDGGDGSGGRTGGDQAGKPMSDYEQAQIDLFREQLNIENLKNQQAAQAQQAANAATQGQTAALNEYLLKTLDPELFRQRQEAQTQAKIAEAQVLQQGAMEKTQEVTRREIEKQTIQAWQGITQAEINRDTAMGLGMMSLAYGTALPNPKVMQAAANFVTAGQAGFTAPKSVI
jgi:hypothetical protein